MKTQKTKRFGKLTWLGIALAISFPVTGLITYALVASLVGESNLENSYSGETTTPGTLAMTLPILLGLTLVVIDLIFKPSLANIWKWVLGSGIAFVATGLIGNSNIAPEQGANIGAGLLIFAGIILSIIGLILMASERKKS